MLRVAEHWSGTDTGLQRRANEDSLLVRSPLFVVADGMGGAQAGEVASSVAVDTFRAGLADGNDPERSLVTQVEQANARINELSHSNAEHAGMGTTITAVYVGERDVAIAHVGDSRAYCMRDGELLRLTDDHSLVDELIRQGKLTPEEAEEHPQRSVITRALGPEATVEVDVRSFRGRPDDVYLLCSDGLTTMVGEAELLLLLASHERLAAAGEALIAAANGAGGKDNITVVLLRLEEVLGGAQQPSDGHTTITAVAAVPLASLVSQERTSIPDPQAGADVAVRDGEHAEPPQSFNGKQAQSVSATPRRPRRPARATQPAKRASLRRRLRRVRALVVLASVVGLLAAAAYLALQSVYFIGTNQRGLVTMYNGLPYELPGKITLYTSDYVSGVSASTLAPAHRQALLDHSLRSEGDAAELMRELELGQLSEG
ncbi:MAG TPA: Stp1/IreP family PP2C-type Ser/Thr phosphatase [Solirubrobacteraceae bacterium]|jgi:protein phosphatase|nr:Stp1/IreP family PP2C-type Ser/Thr phosphatase [Solirubrobacteraceae bacterium]